MSLLSFITDFYNAFSFTRVDPPVETIKTHPGIRGYAPRGVSATQDGAYSILCLHGDQPITQPASIRLWGAAPSVYGFDCNFTLNGVLKNCQIRHTPVSGDTQLNVLRCLLDNFMHHPDIKALYESYPDGADILSYCYVRREPAYGEPHRINIFGHWKMIADTNIALGSSGGGVLVEGVQSNGTLSPALETAPFLHISRSTFDGGRPPQAGDAIGSITFGHDLQANGGIPTPWRKSDARNADPMYGQIMVAVVDPITGKSRIYFTFDEFVFQDKSGNAARFRPVGNTFQPF